MTGSVSSVGALLQARREGARVSLEDAAARLRIRRALLEALEAGDHDKLPGPAYAVGFVRSYADFLGLDAEDVVRQFKAELAVDHARPQLNFPSPAPQGKFPGTGAIVASLVGLVLIVGGWLTFQDGEGGFELRVPELPGRLIAGMADTPAPPAPPPAAATVPTVAPAPQPLAPLAPAVVTPLTPLPAPRPVPATLPPPPGDAPRTLTPPQVAVAATPAPVERTAPEDDAPAPTALTPSAPSLSADGEPAAAPTIAAAPPVVDGRVFGQTSGETRITIRARGDSWVQVRAANGEPLWSRLLRAGDSYLVPNRPGLVLATGNAGNLDLAVDGTTVPSIGDVGVVRRGVALDPDRLRAGTAVIPNAPPISGN